MFERLDDTIVAISSAVGTGPRGIVRLSGPGAHALAGKIFQADDGPDLVEAGGHRRLTGRVWITPDAAVVAEAYSFRAPASYTRQDLVEIHTVGSPPVLAMLLDRLTSLGARPAEPGEFTARAFFSGAMDLTRVEGVAAMIAAQNDAQLRASEALLHGRLGRQAAVLRQQLADLLALVEADIDFAEEPIEFFSRADAAVTLNTVAASLSRLVHEAPSVERLEVLPTVLLTGPPNAGKSTLFNRLTGMDRVIQSAVAGTTRDIISTPLTLEGGDVLLQDSPGLDASAEVADMIPPDAPDSLARRRARQRLQTADVLVVVADIHAPPTVALDPIRDTISDRRWCLVANKIDLAGTAQTSAWIAHARRFAGTVLPVSARTGEGVDRLKAYLNNLLFASGRYVPKDLLALSSRQRTALQEALQAVERARAWCDDTEASGEGPELLALHLREAIHAFSLLEGRITTEDLLDRIFSRFCIGK